MQHQTSTTPNLIHLLDQSIDLLLPISQVTSLNEMLEFPRPESASRVAQLEWPQKVAGLLEIRPHSNNLMDQVLHTDDAKFAQLLLDDLVIGEGNALLVNLPVAALVDEVADGFDTGVAVGDIGLDYFEHFGGGFGEFDEDAVIDLEEAEELKDLAGFGGDFVDTVEDVRIVVWHSIGKRAIDPLMRTTKTSLGSSGT